MESQSMHRRRMNIGKLSTGRPSMRVPPPSHPFKINFNDSFVASSHTVSSDMVVRDSVGAVLAATAFPLSNVDSSTLTEALACVRSLELAVGLGFHTVQVECD
ncbi:hypothetical protein V6N13_029030 [Hibiscus sabdariffa]